MSDGCGCDNDNSIFPNNSIAQTCRGSQSSTQGYGYHLNEGRTALQCDDYFHVMNLSVHPTSLSRALRQLNSTGLKQSLSEDKQRKIFETDIDRHFIINQWII